MPTYRDEAIVLRTHKLGEADRIITLFTRVHGKVRAVARGVRRTSSKFGGRLEPFSHVDLQLAEGRSLDIVTQAVQLHAWADPLTADYELFTAGQVMLETVDKLVPVEGEPALQQYLLLAGAVRTLAQTGRPEASARTAPMVLNSYLLRAQAIAGYAPTLDACARCGVALPEPGQPDQVWFSPMAGGLVCLRHRAPGSVRVTADEQLLLQGLLTGAWEVITGAAVPVHRQVTGMVSAYTQWHLDHGLRTMNYLERSWQGRDPQS
ncbi:DNA repair protein RecO [Propionibacteriaceae bacterium G1746]